MADPSGAEHRPTTSTTRCWASASRRAWPSRMRFPRGWSWRRARSRRPPAPVTGRVDPVGTGEPPGGGSGTLAYKVKRPAAPARRRPCTRRPNTTSRYHGAESDADETPTATRTSTRPTVTAFDHAHLRLYAHRHAATTGTTTGTASLLAGRSNGLRLSSTRTATGTRSRRSRNGRHDGAAVQERPREPATTDDRASAATISSRACRSATTRSLTTCRLATATTSSQRATVTFNPCKGWRPRPQFRRHGRAHCSARPLRRATAATVALDPAPNCQGGTSGREPVQSGTQACHCRAQPGSGYQFVELGGDASRVGESDRPDPGRRQVGHCEFRGVFPADDERRPGRLGDGRAPALRANCQGGGANLYNPGTMVNLTASPGEQLELQELERRRWPARKSDVGDDERGDES